MRTVLNSEQLKRLNSTIQKILSNPSIVVTDQLHDMPIKSVVKDVTNGIVITMMKVETKNLLQVIVYHPQGKKWEDGTVCYSVLV